MGEPVCKALHATPQNTVADNDKTRIRHTRDDEWPGVDQEINPLSHVEAGNADTEPALMFHGQMRNPGGKIHNLREEKHALRGKAVVPEENVPRVRAVTKDAICSAQCPHLKGNENVFPSLAGDRLGLLEVRMVADRNAGAARSPEKKKTAGSDGKEQKIETFTRRPGAEENIGNHREEDVMGSKPQRMRLGSEQRYRHPPCLKGTLHFLKCPPQSAFRPLEIERRNTDSDVMSRGHDGREGGSSGHCTGPSSSQKRGGDRRVCEASYEPPFDTRLHYTVERMPLSLDR